MKTLLAVLMLLAPFAQAQEPVMILLMGSKARLVALPATGVSDSGFIANWQTLPGGSSYKLDVGLDAGFASFLTDYEDKDVTGTADTITTADASTQYWYRLRATKGGKTYSSNVITVTTSAGATPQYALKASGGEYLKDSDDNYLAYTP
jgi:hypothetical protein